jgi:REP element-mobilizing transposase RayT
MPRKPRLEYAGAIYHVMNRGDHKERIFIDENDRHMFLATLAETCKKTGWQVHAYCLLPNHLHLVVETPKANLVAGMRWLLSTYTLRFNRRHNLCGHLFSGRYKALFVDSSGDGYLKTVCDYVHLNPVRARLLKGEQNLNDYPWSSYGQYLTKPEQRWSWLRVDRLLGEHGIPKDSSAGRREFAKRMELRRVSESTDDVRSVERQWILGSPEFRQELLAQLSRVLRSGHSGEAVREVTENQAERIIKEELEQRKLDDSKLPGLRKGDPVKVAIAQRLREETTMTLAWIAQRLQTGGGSYLNHLLYWHRRRASQPSAAKQGK